MGELIRVPRGLAGVAVTETSIAKSDADGSLVYRGYPIRELADNASFGEVAYLILYGRLPGGRELEAFDSGLVSASRVDDVTMGVLRSLPADSHPIDALRTAISALGSSDRGLSLKDAQTSIAGKMATLAANCWRLPRKESPVFPEAGVGFAQNLLAMVTSKSHDDFDRWVFERVLIFYLEHDLNASSYTVRVVASTLADPYAAVTAGLAALKGPLHGGANEASMQMFLAIGESGNAVAFLDRELEAGRKVIGFGHRVYKKFDPRARLCKEYLRMMVDRGKAKSEVYDLCDTLEKEMWKRKGLPPNLDYYAAPIFYSLGVPIPLFTPLFAASRVFGWLAHYEEQLAENKLIRPDALYIGPTDLKYKPIAER